jgi:bifunctional non-homologous end joining protein LigD
MPFFQPMLLGRKAEPFDYPEWVYDLKYDGFRALAAVEYGRCALFSRNGDPFASVSQLASRIGYALTPRSVVLDGEIVCLDQEGRCQFNDLLFRRGDPCFIAFDILQVNQRDLRRERLIDRNHELQRITSGLSPIVYADHIRGTGIALFKKACELDLEGIVAKDRRAPYDPQRRKGLKRMSVGYTQLTNASSVDRQAAIF